MSTVKMPLAGLLSLIFTGIGCGGYQGKLKDDSHSEISASIVAPNATAFQSSYENPICSQAQKLNPEAKIVCASSTSYGVCLDTAYRNQGYQIICPSWQGGMMDIPWIQVGGQMKSLGVADGPFITASDGSNLMPRSGAHIATSKGGAVNVWSASDRGMIEAHALNSDGQEGLFYCETSLTDTCDPADASIQVPACTQNDCVAPPHAEGINMRICTPKSAKIMGTSELLGISSSKAVMPSTLSCGR